MMFPSTSVQTIPCKNVQDYFQIRSVYELRMARDGDAWNPPNNRCCLSLSQVSFSAWTRVLKAYQLPLLDSILSCPSTTESFDMAQVASSQPERKRPRFSPEDEDEDEKPFVNHTTLYFDDGNVILAAGRMLFCVHRSLLSKHSSVLHDLFEESRARFRGLLHLEMEETSEEVEALLNVIYDGL